MAEVAPLDRRQRRRRETIEEALDVAAEVMADQGVAGLTLGEVARRMGIRPPSLYVYFDSKNALYDALFERGYRRLLSSIEEGSGSADELDPVTRTHTHAVAMVRWSVEHPAYAPLMFWRPVPGFTPSAAAYAPAVELSRRGREFVADLQARGALAEDVDLDRAFRSWTALISGVVSQQMSNAPGEPFETGTFTSTLPDLVAMWLTHYGGRGAERTETRTVPEPTRAAAARRATGIAVPAGTRGRDESKESR
jgi:AcrR family transcriptional regulator